MRCNWFLSQANIIKNHLTEAKNWRKMKNLCNYPQLRLSLSSLKRNTDQYSACPSFTGLWLSGVPVVWHAAGDEGAIWRNPAEEMEYHLQVDSDVHVASWCESPSVYLRACFHVQRGHNAHCTDLHLFSHRGAPCFGTTPRTQTHAHTCSCWVVGNFLILVLKFYNQPERGSLLKQTSGTFFTLQNG